MIEREIKVMLTRLEFITILKKMCVSFVPSVQTNYYFDTEDLSMNKKGITCRIRYKDGKYKTTVKNHNANNPELSIEQDFYESPELNPNIFNMLGLLCHGELVTERYSLYKNEYCEMVVDRSSYLGKTDFELEIEYSEGFKEKAEKCLDDVTEFFLCQQCILEKDEFTSRVQKGKSKSERFFDELSKK